MARRVYAKRYSRAVFEIALEKDELDKWQSYLTKIASVNEDIPFVALLQNPKLSFDIKVKLLAERLGDIEPLASNLVHLLVAKGKLNLAGDIADEYHGCWINIVV